jgi:ABC-type lipoprotein release transport system permease subunit
VRTLATAAVIAAASGVVLLMLATAVFLRRLENDPGTLDKRYQLTVNAPPQDAARIAAVSGIADAAPRYEVVASASFELGLPVEVVGFPGDHTRFEAPALAQGRRIAGSDEAEVGLGLANVLGLEPGATLALELPSGREARFAVVGIVRSLENEGRVAWVRPKRLLAADPAVVSVVAAKLAAGADRDGVVRSLADRGFEAASSSGSTATRSRTFLGALADVLWVVAGVNVLICLYALVQALTVTAAEQRRTIAILRTSGAGRSAITLVMVGAATAVVVIALPVGIALERVLLGPVVARLAAGYATLPLGASAGELALTVAAIGAIAAAAGAWVARRAESEPIATALRSE